MKLYNPQGQDTTYPLRQISQELSLGDYSPRCRLLAHTSFCPDYVAPMPVSAPSVTLIIPAYNAARELDRCLDSVLSEYPTDLEILVIDDGSIDATFEIAHRRSRQDRRVRVLSGHNGGPSAARNRGLDEARGHYITFLDADDWLEPGSLAAMTNAALESDADIVMAGAIVDFVDQEDHVCNRRLQVPMPYEGPREELLLQQPLSSTIVNLLGYVWNKVYRRTLLVGTGARFPEDINLYEDIEFNQTAFAAATRITLLPDAFVHYVQRDRASAGNIYRSNQLPLRLRALDSLGGLLHSLGASQVDQESMQSELSLGALRAALLQIAAAPINPLQKRHQLVTLRRDPAAKRLLALIEESTLGPSDRLLLLAFSCAPPLLLVTGMALRQVAARLNTHLRRPPFQVPPTDQAHYHQGISKLDSSNTHPEGS